MPARVAPVERIRAEVDRLFADPSRALAEVVEEPAGLGARLLLQSALEAEIKMFLVGSATSATPTPIRATATVTSRSPSRRPVGPLHLERPKVRGTAQRFASQLLGAHVTRTNGLEALVIAGFVRGLSTRDVEATWPRRSARRPR